MKKYCLIFMMVISIFLITGCGSKNYLVEISYDEYQELLNNKETFVLEVMKQDCSACKGFRPKLKKVAKEYKVEIRYLDYSKLTVEQQETIEVSSTPTLIFYQNGEEETTSARLVGNQAEKKIIEKLKASSFID